MEGSGTEQRVRAPVGMSDKSSEGENTRNKGGESRDEQKEHTPWEKLRLNKADGYAWAGRSLAEFESCLCTAKEILIRLTMWSVTKLFCFICVQKPLLLRDGTILLALPENVNFRIQI